MLGAVGVGAGLEESCFLLLRAASWAAWLKTWAALCRRNDDLAAQGTLHVGEEWDAKAVLQSRSNEVSIPIKEREKRAPWERLLPLVRPVPSRCPV